MTLRGTGESGAGASSLDRRAEPCREAPSRGQAGILCQWPLQGIVYPWASCAHAESKQPGGPLGRHRRLHLRCWKPRHRQEARRPGERLSQQPYRPSSRSISLHRTYSCSTSHTHPSWSLCRCPPDASSHRARVCARHLPAVAQSPGQCQHRPGPQILVNGRMTEQNPLGHVQGTWSAVIVHSSLLDKH